MTTNRRPVGGLGDWAERRSSGAFIWPSVIVVLLLSIFPLVVSLYLSLSRFQFVRGGFEIEFVGLRNYRKLLVGSEQSHFLGVFGDLTPGRMILLGLVALALIVWLVRYGRGDGSTAAGFIWRAITALISSALAALMIFTLGEGGRPGTVGVTLIYVFVGIFFQYSIALLLAFITTQRIAGRRFFRVAFLIPMMITPVGVAYMFRMLTDTSIGPLKPIWVMLGLSGYSWVNQPWGARWAVMIGDIWQWTPFMFIILLAALEGQSVEPLEAGVVDGANRWQLFRFITFPQILPVSITLILIRMIEAFKIVDLPNVLTNGGPGTATESLTLHSFFSWRALDLGSSAAIAYSLLIIVTFFGLVFVNLIHRRVAESL